MQTQIRRLLPTKLWNGKATEVFCDAVNLVKYRTTDMFKVVEVETIATCNRTCSYCPNSAFDRGHAKNEKLMGEDVFRLIVDQLAEVGFWGRLSPHFYGEPLLDERLEGLMAYARKKLPLTKLVIFTNGDLLGPDRYQSLVNAGVDGFLVTQHGERPSPKLVKLRRKLDQTPDDRGIRFDYRAFTSESELSNRAGLVDHALLETKSDCGLPAENVTIDHAGNVVLCCNDYHSSVKFGNVRETHLMEIWRSEDFRRIRRDLLGGHFELEICQKCASGKLALTPPGAAQGAE
jgi:radical SAM protein with 4Fe4S-binding SPASM domain